MFSCGAGVSFTAHPESIDSFYIDEWSTKFLFVLAPVKTERLPSRAVGLLHGAYSGGAFSICLGSWRLDYLVSLARSGRFDRHHVQVLLVRHAKDISCTYSTMLVSSFALLKLGSIRLAQVDLIAVALIELVVGVDHSP